MNDEFYPQIEKIKKQEKQLKSDITKRNELDMKNLPTSLVRLLNSGRCGYSRIF
jgi:hypothetical protein